MNRAEYLSSIRILCGEIKEEVIPDRELKLKVKQKRIKLAKLLYSFDRERLETSHTYSLAGSAKVEYQDLPSGFISDLSMTINGEQAFKIAYEDYVAIDDNIYFTPTATMPAYFIRKDQVGMIPTSASTNAVLFFLSKPTAFSDETTDEADLALNIPSEFQDLVVQLVCEELNAREDINVTFKTTVQQKIEAFYGKKAKDPKRGKEALQ